MATEILRPQDCLGQRVRVPPCRRRNYNYGQNHNHSYNDPYSYSNQAIRYYENSNNRFSRKPAGRSERTDQRRRQSEPSAPVNKRSSSSDDLKFSRNHQNHHGGKGARENLAMEKVSILRRGESLDSKMKSMEMAAAVTETDRPGPDPATVRKQIRISDFGSPAKTDMYAGSGFAVSPAPSSLPLPSFFKKKQLAVDDSATRDLRRLLRLEL